MTSWSKSIGRLSVVRRVGQQSGYVAPRVDITFNVRLHVHNKNQLLVIDTTARTSEGHLATGHETQMLTPNGQLRTTFNIINEHPTTGEKFSVKGHIRLDTATGELLQQTFRTRCIRPAS